MKKIVFLGCENSHSDTFLSFLKGSDAYADIEVLGVYSDERESAEKLGEKYNVPVLHTFDECVGKVDGVVVTARHGIKHYEFARPYMETCKVMFIDKPITTDAREIKRFLGDLVNNNVRVCGGSSLIHDDVVIQLKADHLGDVDGKTIGGIVRAPIQSQSVYGGFYFYAQHLTEMVLEIFGRYPKSVKVYEQQGTYTTIFRYDDYDVTGVFVEGGYCYYSARFTKSNTKGIVSVLDSANPLFRREWDEFCELLRGGEQKMSFEDFFAPVYVMDAIVRAISSGVEETIKYEF